MGLGEMACGVPGMGSTAAGAGGPGGSSYTQMQTATQSTSVTASPVTHIQLPATGQILASPSAGPVILAIAGLAAALGLGWLLTR